MLSQESFVGDFQNHQSNRDFDDSIAKYSEADRGKLYDSFGGKQTDIKSLQRQRDDIWNEDLKKDLNQIDSTNDDRSQLNPDSTSFGYMSNHKTIDVSVKEISKLSDHKSSVTTHQSVASNLSADSLTMICFETLRDIIKEYCFFSNP